MSRRTNSRKALTVYSVIVSIIVAALIILAVLQFATPYKPSNGFKRTVEETEQTEQLPDEKNDADKKAPEESGGQGNQTPEQGGEQGNQDENSTEE